MEEKVDDAYLIQVIIDRAIYYGVALSLLVIDRFPF